MDKFDSNGQGLVNEGFIGENWSHLDMGGIMKQISDRVVSKVDKPTNIPGKIEQRIIKLKGL